MRSSFARRSRFQANWFRRIRPPGTAAGLLSPCVRRVDGPLVGSLDVRVLTLDHIRELPVHGTKPRVCLACILTSCVALRVVVDPWDTAALIPRARGPVRERLRATKSPPGPSCWPGPPPPAGRIRFPGRAGARGSSPPSRPLDRHRTETSHRGMFDPMKLFRFRVESLRKLPISRRARVLLRGGIRLPTGLVARGVVGPVPQPGQGVRGVPEGGLLRSREGTWPRGSASLAWSRSRCRDPCCPPWGSPITFRTERHAGRWPQREQR